MACRLPHRRYPLCHGKPRLRCIWHITPAPQSVAAAAGVAPSQLCSDFALWEMVRQRPGVAPGLAACQGCSELFVQRHGQVRQLCDGAFVSLCRVCLSRLMLGI